MVHALQDQLTDSKRVFKISNLDENIAFSAVSEGYADFVMERVGWKLGLNDVMKEFHVVYVENRINLDPNTYYDGKRFILYHHKQGGNERIWGILKNPPTKTSMILSPETYQHEKVSTFDYSSLLGNLRVDFNDEDWTVTNIDLGQFAFEKIFPLMTEKNKKDISVNINHYQVFAAVKEKSKGSFAASFILFKDDSSAAHYIEIMHQQDKITDQKCWDESVYRKLTFSELKGVKADFAQKTVFKVRLHTVSLISRVCIRIRKNNVVLDFQVDDMDISDAKIIEYSERIFSDYEKLVTSNSNEESKTE